jgi:hypothetical protein
VVGEKGLNKTALFLAGKPSPVGEELHLPLNGAHFISNVGILQPCIRWFQYPFIRDRVGRFIVWSDRGLCDSIGAGYRLWVCFFIRIGDGTGKNNGSGF